MFDLLNTTTQYDIVYRRTFSSCRSGTELMCTCLETCAYVSGMSNVLRCAMWVHAICQAEWSLSLSLNPPALTPLPISRSSSCHPAFSLHQEPAAHRQLIRAEEQKDGEEWRQSKFLHLLCAIQIRSSRKRSSNIHLFSLPAQRVKQGQSNAPTCSTLEEEKI